jgi:hypothetical protein
MRTAARSGPEGDLHVVDAQNIAPLLEKLQRLALLRVDERVVAAHPFLEITAAVVCAD